MNEGLLALASLQTTKIRIQGELVDQVATCTGK